MKSVPLLVRLAVPCLLLAGCSSNASVSENVVARVNTKEITEAELDKQYQSRINGAPQAPTPEEREALRFQLVQQMVDDEILLQMATSAGLNATDAEVETKYTDFKSQYTEEQFQESLKQQKLQPEDIKADMRKALTLEKLITKEITSRINVSQAEINDVFAKNKEKFNLPESYHVQHIMVTPFPDQQVTNLKRDDARSEAEAQAKAERLLREIQGGHDFAIVARDWSEDYETAPNGGDLSFRSLEQLESIDPKIKQAVTHLRVGESSPLIQTRFGYHILKLLEKDQGGQKDLNSASVSAQIRQAIFNQKEQMLRAAFSEVARNKAQVNNYLAERLLESAGKAAAAAPEAKTESKTDTKAAEPKQEQKPEQKKEEAKAPEKSAEPKKD